MVRDTDREPHESDQPTEQGRNPDITGHFLLAGVFSGLQILSLVLLFFCLGPWEGDLEHARCTHKAILAPPL